MLPLDLCVWLVSDTGVGVCIGRGFPFPAALYGFPLLVYTVYNYILLSMTNVRFTGQKCPFKKLFLVF